MRIPGVEEECDLGVRVVKFGLHHGVIEHGQVRPAVIPRENHPILFIEINQPWCSVH